MGKKVTKANGSTALVGSAKLDKRATGLAAIGDFDRYIFKGKARELTRAARNVEAAAPYLAKIKSNRSRSIVASLRRLEAAQVTIDEIGNRLATLLGRAADGARYNGPKTDKARIKRLDDLALAARSGKWREVLKLETANV